MTKVSEISEPTWAPRPLKTQRQTPATDTSVSDKAAAVAAPILFASKSPRWGLLSSRYTPCHTIVAPIDEKIDPELFLLPTPPPPSPTLSNPRSEISDSDGVPSSVTSLDSDVETSNVEQIEQETPPTRSLKGRVALVLSIVMQTSFFVSLLIALWNILHPGLDPHIEPVLKKQKV